MSAPEGVTLVSWSADVVELAAFRGRGAELERLAAERGSALPGPGRVAERSGGLALNVRPERWLLLGPRASPGASAAHWQELCSGSAAVVDLSAALAAFVFSGPAHAEVLARGCRLDLDARAFPVGSAAATIMVQVPVILARLTAGMLLLSPATTARHLREWVVETSRPFGLARSAEAVPGEVYGVVST